MSLSDDERALYTELIVLLAIRMTDVAFDRPPGADSQASKNPDPIESRIIEHGSASHFENACSVLHRAGVLSPLESDETPKADQDAWAAWFRIRFDVPQLREHLRLNLPASAPSLYLVLEAFLGIMTDYRCEISAGREAFRVHEGFETLFALLHRCGYADHLGDEVKWTNKVLPQMRALYLWDEDGVPVDEYQGAEIEEMWRTLPATIRKEIFSKWPVDVVSLSAVIKRLWDGSRWHSTASSAEASGRSARGDAVSKARRLVMKYEESES